MSNNSIVVEDISKSYRLGSFRRSRTFREAIVDTVLGTASRLISSDDQPRPSEPFWALQDISFAVNEGDVLGIIGRNGAGKSTLLKLMSRIVAPTTGRIALRGKVSSLLEVGTGFHPELSGRENIYLNGAILGMKRRDITKRFDEIVDFSGVEKFLDTPVKRYSSGMYVRLAFAVAANMDSDILIVDEVLAVGDAEFQKKCLSKMNDVAHKGDRTVLFVSHNMQAVRRLCNKCLVLSNGRMQEIGDTTDVISRHMAATNTISGIVNWSPRAAPGVAGFKLLEVRVLKPGTASPSLGGLSSRDPIAVEMAFSTDITSTDLEVGFDLMTSDGATVLRTYHTDCEYDDWPKIARGKNRFVCIIPPGLLNAGRYQVCPRVGMHKIRWIIESDAVIGFDVTLDHGNSPHWVGISRPGAVSPILQWEARPQ